MKLQRMCAVCREKKSRDQLLRVVRQQSGAVLDRECKIQGRGAYICKDEKCISVARKARAFERSLSMRIDSTVYDEVEALLNNE